MRAKKAKRAKSKKVNVMAFVKKLDRLTASKVSRGKKAKKPSSRIESVGMVVSIRGRDDERGLPTGPVPSTMPQSKQDYFLGYSGSCRIAQCRRV